MNTLTQLDIFGNQESINEFLTLSGNNMDDFHSPYPKV